MTTTTAAPVAPISSGAGRAFVTGWLAAGVLDIGDAVVMTLAHGKSPEKMLQGIASALVGKSAGDGGLATAALGLGLHFAIMAAMAGMFVLAAGRLAVLTRRPVLMGLAYGFALYLVMNWIVLPLRWPQTWASAKPEQLANQLFAHLILVGLPISLITARFLRRP